MGLTRAGRPDPAAIIPPPPDSGPGRETRRRARPGAGPGVYGAAVAVLALGAVALTLWFTWNGVGLATDSATYLSAADNLAHGHGATTAFAGETTRYSPAQQVAFGHEVPMAEYPPAYSLALSAPDALGLSRSTAVRIVNALSLAALVALVGVALWWLFRPPVVALVALGLLVVSSPTIGSFIGALNPLGLASFALSEALFLPLCLLALLAAAHAATRADRRSAVAAAAIVALATLTRYVGASTGLAAGTAVLLVGGGRGASRAARGALLALTGIAAIVGWDVLSAALWGAGPTKAVVWHPGNIRIHLAVDVAGAWFHLPPAWPWAVRAALVVVLVLAPAALVLAPAVVRWLRPAAAGPSRALLIALGSFVLAYLVAVGVTQLLLDDSTEPNQRLLAPVQLASYLLLAAVLALAGDRLAARRWPRQRLGCTLVVVLATAVVVQPLFRLNTLATALHHSADTARAQAAADPLRALPRGLVVFSDSPSGLWLYSGEGSYRLPTEVVFTTGRPDRSYPAEVRQTEAIVKQRGGLIVVSSQASAATYTSNDALRTVAACRTGEILLAVPGSKGATAAARACPRPAAPPSVAIVKRALQPTSTPTTSIAGRRAAGPARQGGGGPTA